VLRNAPSTCATKGRAATRPGSSPHDWWYAGNTAAAPAALHIDQTHWAAVERAHCSSVHQWASQARARLLRLEQLPIELVQDHIVALAFFEPRHGRLEVPRGSQSICACPNICTPNLSSQLLTTRLAQGRRMQGLSPCSCTIFLIQT